MPLMKTHLRSGRSAEEKQAVGDAVQAALAEVLDVPSDDLYQLFAEYGEADFRRTDGYLGLNYSDQQRRITRRSVSQARACRPT